MSDPRKDWRADVSKIDNLYDVDPMCMMVFLRHQFLLTAKDMADDDTDFGDQCCEVAEAIQSAIEAQMDPITALQF